MRYAVISDLHANLEALEAVLADMDPHHVEGVLVLGDLVGYGADPNAVVERTRALDHAVMIRGNHDKVAVGIEPSHTFNAHARAAIVWTASVLTPDNHAFLAALPQGPLIVDPLLEICHGAPFDEDVYVFDDFEAQRSLRAARRSICFCGHTHVPALFELRGEMVLSERPRGDSVTLSVSNRGPLLINCGSVGQPRDGDPRAAWGLVDTVGGTIAIRRVPYDIGAAQAKILAAGLPPSLAERLALGR